VGCRQSQAHYGTHLQGPRRGQAWVTQAVTVAWFILVLVPTKVTHTHTHTHHILRRCGVQTIEGQGWQPFLSMTIYCEHVTLPYRLPNSTRMWKLLTIAEFRTPTPHDVRKKGSKILKLPSVFNCFTLAMTNKLVAIINSLRVPKIKKILLYEMKFLVPNYSCLYNPWVWGCRTQIPVLSVLCPQLNLLNSLRTKFLGKPLTCHTRFLNGSLYLIGQSRGCLAIDHGHLTAVAGTVQKQGYEACNVYGSTNCNNLPLHKPLNTVVVLGEQKKQPCLRTKHTYC